MRNFLRQVRISVSVSALLALLLGLALTALLFVSVRGVESQARADQFKREATLRINAVSGGLSDAIEQLMVVNQLFNTVGVVSREQFHSFTAPLLARYPELQALSFQRVVSDAERPAYEARQRRRAPDFAITEFTNERHEPAQKRPYYNVVEYIEPVAGNGIALGLDTAALTTYGDARSRSRRNGRVTATGLLSLVQYRGFHTGFLVLAPVYQRQAAPDSASPGQRAVIGETAAVFRVDHLIHTLLGNARLLDQPGMSINIYAAGAAQAAQLAFSNGKAPPPATSALLPGWLLYDHPAPVNALFHVAQEPWFIEVTGEPRSIIASHAGSWYALLGGVFSSLLAAGYVYSLVSRRSTIERVASERTAALQFANLRLTEDLALRKRTEKALRLREKVIEVSANAVIICNAQAPEYAVEYVNPAFEKLTGFCAAEVIGKSLKSLQGDGHDQQNIDEITAALREQREGHAVVRSFRKDGSGYWNDLFIAPVRDDAGAISHFVVAQYDISAVMRFEAELEYQANHDVLTGLANRHLLAERLSSAIAQAQRAGTELWVVFVDLDRFKFVNDTLGHEAGDAMLRVLGGRIKGAVDDGDTVSRMGGDEFVLVLPGRPGDGDGLRVLQRIMDAVAEPLRIQAHEFFVTCSLGVAVYPADGGNADTLTKHADIAMYRAKEMGRNTYQFYCPEMNARTLERLQIEADLRHALERNELVLHYQPQIDVGSGAIVGMEALLRWEHPVLGTVSPLRFIALAEEMGLIIPIGAWVIRTACLQNMAWQKAGMARLRMAVNLSARQFTGKDLLQSVGDALEESGLEARYLELELTESMVMSDVENTITILRMLKQLGVHLAIDDFGTGYSSLSYLSRFPLDVLKIDQSFVRDIAVGADAAAIVVSIISLAHSLRLKVIAEGVETAAQLAFLREHGCDEVQGYFFSRPVGALEFESLLVHATCTMD
ncbi:bifunctional diguanylate cyclase/phosphodiesterase [Massilia antarctica]|uniref:bifunctional diguanylate cyclase/phosphodiesterase n=1 Tax=Massilia antarctica TaxID=2765360 RepID=UPI0006BB771E|nr:EAL domain-containing protein [Massilia sp. H27-R4]MCY0915488.1 EAL domain-containing protein [Massilia sp. H27-R4]CUI04161.1 diguanylate cyclase/phosphodiesterase (GGDEF & EAL domains) with PAS/PAC sensor(s) [Janthinobacterium sp. CG23_2]CUU27947.1 diguanylate cyclase/phosphodiesterase (GGDEF & EAL domains) with PAS/PAC sensor(s) [Janthinobacterium sp. CG23_2]